MLIKIKPHSSFYEFFDKSEYTADLTTYYDLIFYLNGIHKRFINYLNAQKNQGLEEGFVFLDKNLREITPDQLKFRHIKKDDIVHIVPAIVGGGGKRGGILSVLAIAAFAFVALPAMAAAGAAAPVGSAVSGSTLFGGASGGFLKNIVANVALSLLSKAFMGSPAKEEQARQNGMFGSLTNSTDSGTPVPMHYGLVRVAGQLINGYVYSAKHGKTQTLDVYGDIVTDNGATSGTDQQTALSKHLKGFNQYD